MVLQERMVTLSFHIALKVQFWADVRFRIHIKGPFMSLCKMKFKVSIKVLKILQKI